MQSWYYVDYPYLEEKVFYWFYLENEAVFANQNTSLWCLHKAQFKYLTISTIMASKAHVKLKSMQLTE